MKILRLTILAFSIWYIPTFALEIYGGSIGSASSYLMFLLVLCYYFVSPKVKPNMSFIILGLAYYTISGFSFVGDFDYYVIKFLKYIIFIVGMSELIRRCKPNILFYFLLVGGLSVIVNALFFPHLYGRYSGFYLNPNLAALIALIGFCFCFNVPNRLLRMIGFGIFIFAGFLTFSRYFILMWIVLSLISAILDKKNLEVLGIGIGSGIIIFAVASLLQVNTSRFTALENILGNKVQQGTEVLSNDSRFETWSYFVDDILDNAVIGKGFYSMSGEIDVSVGVHNSLLLTIGEAGIIPFFLMCFIYINLLLVAWTQIQTNLYKLLLALSLISYLFVSHNFYDNYVLLLFSLWAVIKTEDTPLAKTQEALG